MNTPDTTDTFLDELVAPLIDSPSLTLTSTYWNGAKASIKQFIENRVKEARVDELKQLEPPEQYEEYAKLMGSEYCRICGFNAIKFREYITKRLKALPINSLGTLTSINNREGYMEYKVTTADFEHFIADWLNSDNNSFQDYVKGVKLFRQYLDERNAAPTKEG